MPHLRKRHAAAEDWEEEDPLDVNKEADNPYDLGLKFSLSERSFRVHFRQASLAQQFQRSDADVAELFASLVGEWREATVMESSLEHIILNSAYQRIIGLGPQVLPYILRDLDETRDHWFWALMAIVGEDKAAGQNSVGAAVEAWLAWGRSIGLFND